MNAGSGREGLRQSLWQAAAPTDLSQSCPYVIRQLELPKVDNANLQAYLRRVSPGRTNTPRLRRLGRHVCGNRGHVSVCLSEEILEFLARLGG